MTSDRWTGGYVFHYISKKEVKADVKRNGDDVRGGWNKPRSEKL